MGNGLISGSLVHSIDFGANGGNGRRLEFVLYSFYEVILDINKSHEAGSTRSPLRSYDVPS